MKNGTPFDEGNMDARLLFEWFDSWFDVRFKHKQCLILLQTNGAFSLSNNDPYNYKVLAEYVGAYWCQMIECDVLYDLRRGALMRDRSQEQALLLEKRTTERLSETHPHFTEMESFATNVLARWFDGAGKLFYRNKYYTDSRQMFEKAISWAQEGKHWFLFPDINSNLLRARFEEQKTAHKTSDLSELTTEYIRLLNETVNDASKHGWVNPLQIHDSNYDSSRFSDPPGTGVPRQDREFFRGLCSILHNLSLTEEQQGLLDSSLKHSSQSEDIAQILCDEYRLAQAINHQARIMSQMARKSSQAENRQKFLKEARKLFSRVQDDLHWRRGQLIARQQSALLAIEISNDLNEVLKNIESLQNLLQEIRNERQFSTGEESSDLEVYTYTVKGLRDAVSRLENWQGGHATLAHEEGNKLENLVEDEELAVARAVRHVVKVSVYKQNFNRAYAAVYETHIGKHLARQDHMKAMALLEEASGRELMDILALDSIRGGDPDPSVFDRNSSEEKAFPLKIQNISRRGRRQGLRREEGKSAQKRLEYLHKGMREQEDEALRNPISVTPHDPEISQKVLELSRQHPGFAMIRYAFFRERHTRRKSFGAFAVRNGNLTFHELDWAKAESSLSNMINDADDKIIPTVDKARVLWDTFLSPVWRSVVPNPNDLPNHLVLIPHGDVFRLPLHLAMENDNALPLAARIPLSFSVSATMHLAAGRYSLRCLRPKADDHLCAILSPGVSGDEICNTQWNYDQLHVLGHIPNGLDDSDWLGDADWNGLAKISEIEPTFLVVACHGSYDPHQTETDLGPTLNFSPQIPYASQFDIAQRLKLSGNLFTALDACVSGQGVGLEGGDVAGFVRSFIAAGAGALGVTLFSVLDDEIAATVRMLLSMTRRMAFKKDPFDLIRTLQCYYASRCESLQDRNDATWKLDACPLVIYL